MTTKEEMKKQSEFLKKFVDSMNGSMGNYIVEEDGRLIPTYISSNMGNMIGMSKEQYLGLCGQDAMECIAPADRERVRTSILETVRLNKAASLAFRSRNGSGGYTWLNGSYSRSGEVGGKPAIRAVFTPVTTQFELQQDMLHNIPGGICLYRWDGHRIIPLVLSSQFARLHGGEVQEQTEQISAVDYEYVHPDDLPGYKNFISRIIEEPGQERFHTFRFWHLKEKRYIWICVNTTDMVREDGSLLIYASYSNVDMIKDAETRLRRNEEMLEQTCGFAGVWTFFYDIEAKTVHSGKLLQEAFGLKPEEKNFPDCMINTEYVPEESAQRYRDMVQRVDQGEDGFLTDIQVRYSAEEKHWLRYEWKIIEWQDEKPKIAIGYARCVDQEKLLEARISMEQQRLLGTEGSLLAYVVSNINQNRVVEHRTFQGEPPIARVGAALSQGAEASGSAITDPEKAKQFLEYHQKEYLVEQYNMGRSSFSLEYRRKKANGTVFWEKNILNILKEPESGNLFLYEYCYDINKEKLLEEIMLAAVNYEYERCGSINLQANQISMLLPDAATGDYRLEIREYDSLCRKYAAEHVLEADREMFLNNVPVQHLKENLAQTGSFEFTHRELGEDGRIHYKLDRHSYYDREKEICLMTRSDITEMVQAEEEKQRQLELALQKEKEAAKAKSDFLSRMSHELRTPLNAVTGYCTLLEENLNAGSENNPQAAEQLKSIQLAAKYLLAIIGDLLDTQKIENGKIELIKTTVNAKEYMKNIVGMIRPEAKLKNIDFSYHRLTRFSENYIVDGVRLQQVLLNILHNAIKFTPEGGTVKMTAESLEQEGDKVILRFQISDTGIGMSREFMETKMYQLFSQENHSITSPYEGTGIGLSISRELVRLMGGDISCESEKGKGTTFTLTIASTFVRQPVRQKKSDRRSYQDLKGVRILLCEDNPMNQDMTKRLLNKMNCEVEVADDGAVGVEKFRQSGEGYFHLVLMDLRMPVMDGFEATRTMRALPRGDAKRIPIVALSANAFEEDARKALDSGMNEHLAKPVDALVLNQKIARYCQKNLLYSE